MFTKVYIKIENKINPTRLLKVIQITLLVIISQLLACKPNKEDSADALALVGGKFLNSEFTTNALKRVFSDSLNISIDFEIDENVLSAENLSNYKMLIMFRDPVTFPNGFESHGWNPQYHCNKPDTIKSDPPIDFDGQRVKWFREEYGSNIRQFVERGGALLLYHHGCYLSSDSESYRELIGGTAEGHPPVRTYKVDITNNEHPITQGVKDFIVTDVQHFVTYEKDEKWIFMKSVNEDDLTYKDFGNSSEAGWAYDYGKGRVCYLAPGHTFEAIWNQEYIKLQQNAANWLLKNL